VVISQDPVHEAKEQIVEEFVNVVGYIIYAGRKIVLNLNKRLSQILDPLLLFKFLNEND
jgi:hypothetical protein